MLYQLSYSRESKDEAGRMRGEGAASEAEPHSPIPHPYLLPLSMLVQGVGFEPT